MNNRELKLFKHLAVSLHFGQTSRACYVTPSALTRTIQRLEEELGEQLFVRDNRSVMLTAAGEVFRRYTDDALQRYELLQTELAQDQVLAGEISLYCSVTAAYSILPAILQRFRLLHPEVHINLETGDAALALNKLQNRETDITVAAFPEHISAKVEFQKLAQTPLVFIAPIAYPKTVSRIGGEVDWKNTPLILAEFGLGRERTENWFRERGEVPNIYAQVAGNEAIIAMVALGCGIGVVPGLVLEKSPLKSQVVLLSVTPELESFSIGVCTMKKNLIRPQVAAFWTVAQGES